MGWWRLIATMALTGALSAPTMAHAEWDARHLKLVRAASTSLRQAVLTAERDLKGKAYAAVASSTTDVITYSVKVLVADKPLFAFIDGKTGKVMQSGAVSGENLVLLREFAKLKGTLLSAIKAAEATAKGKAFDGSFKRLGGKSIIEVDVAGRDDVEKDVVIDATSGKIRKVTEKVADTSAAIPAGEPAANAASP